MKISPILLQLSDLYIPRIKSFIPKTSYLILENNNSFLKELIYKIEKKYKTFIIELELINKESQINEYEKLKKIFKDYEDKITANKFDEEFKEFILKIIFTTEDILKLEQFIVTENSINEKINSSCLNEEFKYLLPKNGSG